MFFGEGEIKGPHGQATGTLLIPRVAVRGTGEGRAPRDKQVSWAKQEGGRGAAPGPLRAGRDHGTWVPSTDWGRL